LTQTSLLPDSSPFPNGLSGSELADRLRVNPGTITRNSEKGADHFAQWSRNEQKTPRGYKPPDPDGFAWQRCGDRYYTIPEKPTP
jgi:hypothetical protein